MTSNIFIDTVNLVARAATSGTALPNVRGKLFAELVLNVRFFDGTGAIIPVDVASVLMEIKMVDAPDGSPALLQSSSPVVTGSGPTTLYAFAFDYADGDALRAALAGLTAPASMILTIQYALAGSQEQIDVAMSFENSYVRPEDQASDPVDADRWRWLTAHATDAGGFAHDDTTRLLSVPGMATNAAAIAAEVTAREEAIASEANTRAAAITSEANTRAAAITAEATARNTAISTAVDGLAAVDSPEFTGTPTAPTPSGSTNNTQIATTAFVQTALANAGVAISSPVMAWVQTNGNDGTAVLGDPAHPYATPQAAYNAGAQAIVLGVGEFGDIAGMTRDITLIGCGAILSIMGNISGTNGSIRGNGRNCVTAGSIYIVAPNGTDGSTGDPINSISAGDGNAGSNAPSITISGLNMTSDAVLISGSGGNGGYGGDGNSGYVGNSGGNGGSGGSGGILTIQDCSINGFGVSFAGTGGNAGNGSNSTDNSSSGGNGGNGGNGGSPGLVVVINSILHGTYSGGANAGAAGTNGSGTGPNSDTPQPGTAGAAGTINSFFSQIATDVSNGETTTYRASLVNGTWYP